MEAKRYIGIMAPSLTANLLSDYKAPQNTIRRWLSDNYYSLPWERTAELFGSANNDKHLPYSKEASLVYLFILMGL